MISLRFSTAVPLVGCILLLQLIIACSSPTTSTRPIQTDSTGVAVLLVDTDHPMSTIDKNIYGQFLEHINHAVVDGLYAEQVQGQGFEGKDFETHWKPRPDNAQVTLVNIPFQKGEKSIRLSPAKGASGISQGRLFVQKGVVYNGSLWVKPEAGTPSMELRITDSGHHEIEIGRASCRERV